MQTLYPVYLALGSRPCLVAGLGKVGCRKLEALLDAKPASVLGLDLLPLAELSPKARELLARPRVSFEQRPCRPSDVLPGMLVFAATSNAEENTRILGLCRAQGALCNMVTMPALGDFEIPALARSGCLSAALSTGGASPALAARLRMELESWLKEHARLATFMGRLRPQVLALGGDSGQNGTLFRKLADSPFEDWLASGDLESCRFWLKAELPQALHPQIEELLHALP